MLPAAEQGNDLPELVKVSATVIVSMTYARLAAASTNPGKLRLLVLLPVLLLLPTLPFRFTSISLRGGTAFLLSWLAIFKLLLLAFGSSGPLSSALRLPTFIAVASLPVNVPTNSPVKTSRFSLLPFVLKLVLLLSISQLYLIRTLVHPRLLLAAYCAYVYLTLELLFGSAALLAGALGLRIEPQVNAPYRATSLQDFWGRRWNLMVTRILRPTVYHPTKRRLGTAVAVVGVFLVSGLMHEVVFYYMTFDPPTGEVTLFFLIQGVCTAAEVRAGKAGLWRPPEAFAVVLTLGFVVGTASWLFFPPLLRAGADVKGFDECMEVVRWLKEFAGRSSSLLS